MAPDDFSRSRRRSPPAILTTSAEYDRCRRTAEHSPSSSFSSCSSSRPQHNRLPRRKSTTLKPSSSQLSSFVRPVPRTYSDPILWTYSGILSPEESSPSNSRRTGAGRGDAVDLPRNQTCLTIFQPTSFSLHGFDDKAKVLLSVTVEGSPGPVKAMVKLGDSVEDAIAAVVDIYRMEGRTPRLDWNAAAVESFQLHHSCFSFQSLNKSHKIGEVGGRSFYLRTRNSSSSSARRSSFHLGAEANDVKPTATQLIVPPPHSVLDFIMASIGTIAMGTRKLLRMLACVACF